MKIFKTLILILLRFQYAAIGLWLVLLFPWLFYWPNGLHGWNGLIMLLMPVIVAFLIYFSFYIVLRLHNASQFFQKILFLFQFVIMLTMLAGIFVMSNPEWAKAAYEEDDILIEQIFLVGMFIFSSCSLIVLNENKRLNKY
jgi:hypothetical protein